MNGDAKTTNPSAAASDLDRYITARYAEWVKYASYHIRQARLPIDPTEVVNDVLCVLLERDTPKLKRLMLIQGVDGTALDYFVMRVIKVGVYSPRSPFRYQRGQHCTDRLEDSLRAVPLGSSDFDYEDAFQQVRRVFEELQVPTLSKRIFAWRFFGGRTFTEWPGEESQKFLYDTFNRILLIISAKIRRKNTS